MFDPEAQIEERTMGIPRVCNISSIGSIGSIGSGLGHKVAPRARCHSDVYQTFENLHSSGVDRPMLIKVPPGAILF